MPAGRKFNTDSFYEKVFAQRINLWMDNFAVRELMLDSRLGQVVGELAGVAGIRIWHDQALYKPPWGNPTGWHLDVPYWSFSSRDALSIWVALDDATLQNGCLYYIPGSHKTARFDNADIGTNMGSLFDVYPEWARCDAIAAPVPAGGAVFHNGLTAHAAGPNLTPRPRRAMTCAYMPDGSRFNGQKNILSDEQVARLKVGDLLNDEAQTPLIWRKGDGATSS